MKKQNISLHDLLLRAAGVIFLLTMLSLWFVCGLLARYTKESRSGNGARVAVFGNVEIREHYAALKDVGDSDINDVYYGGKFVDMVYALDDSSEVDGNTYDVVMPGVDIPKDTFVRVYSAETDIELYIEVVEKNFPVYTKKTAADDSDSDAVEEPVKAVTYAVDDKWEKVDLPGEHLGDVYKYTDVIEAGSGVREINILSGEKLIVSQYYDADSYKKTGGDFSMEFYAWTVQKD